MGHYCSVFLESYFMHLKVLTQCKLKVSEVDTKKADKDLLMFLSFQMFAQAQFVLREKASAKSSACWMQIVINGNTVAKLAVGKRVVRTCMQWRGLRDDRMSSLWERLNSTLHHFKSHIPRIHECKSHKVSPYYCLPLCKVKENSLSFIKNIILLWVSF